MRRARAGASCRPGRPQFTRALTSLRTLRGMLATALRTYERHLDDPAGSGLARISVDDHPHQGRGLGARGRIVLAALRACGLSGYRNDSEFSIERHLRDVLSAPIMINNERILANLAATALMTPVPGSVRDE